MGITLIFFGLFLWFAYAFNGSVGNLLVNYSFLASALFMVIAGTLRTITSKNTISRYFCIAALICYLPMVWQRFNFKYGTDWVGFYFDVAIILFMLVFILKNLTNRLSAPVKDTGGTREKASRAP